MSKREMELIDIIFNDRDPKQALSIAINIIFDVAARLEAAQSPRPVRSQEIP